MARIVKPKWGFELEHDSKDFDRRMDNLSFEHLSSQIGFNDTNKDDYRLDMFYHCILVFHSEQFDIASPTGKEVEAALNELREATQKFSFCVANLDYSSRGYLGNGFNIAFENIEDESDITPIADLLFQNRKKFEDMLGNMVVAIDHAPIGTDKTKRGRKGLPAFQNLIWQFAKYYEENTENKPSKGFKIDPYDDHRCSGPFFDVVEYFISHFAPDLNLTNQSIGAYIRRTVGDKAKR